MNTRNKVIIAICTVVILGVAGYFAWQYWGNSSQDNDAEFKPSEEFKPAYDALNSKHEPAYDIEETVRIMNSLEVAQSQSEDFTSYLEYVAKQDYSKVAPDVLEAKEKLLPVLQKMFDLKKQHDELDNIWMLARSATSGAESFAESYNPVGTLATVCTGGTFDVINLNNGLNSAQTAAFEQYKKDKELKESLNKQIEELRLEYIKYLEEYAPVYFKYMKEWNKLCLNKDKAYIDLYSGRMVDAYNSADKILASYPNNREALLLKALSLINIASNYEINSKSSSSSITSQDADGEGSDSTQYISLYKELNIIAQQPNEINDLYIEADNIISQYMELYPERSAPALVLKGLLNHRIGKEQQAMSYFDQAAMEYPRQAKSLTDLLDSYRNRTYLNQSSEGKYLLRLYRATMEGYGMFSPNLLKAKYYAQQGDFDKSKEEIFNHFFRRGNQGIYDCLLSDMQYCEDNMYSSFKQLLMEQSFIDVSVEPTTAWTLTDNDDEIRVIINNRSDIDLENVRIFLCIHYTDMYKDEYDVQKLPAVNIIKHNDKTEIGTVKLNYEDKKYNDITRIRAIAMTDDKICWIDNVDYKYMKASDASRSGKKTNAREGYLNDFAINNQALQEAIQTGINIMTVVNDDDSWWGKIKRLWSSDDDKLSIELPRILTLIDPVFSLYEINDRDHAIRPDEDYLSGSSIRLKFDYEPKADDTIPLYIYSDFVNFKITIHFDGVKPEIKSVEIV